MKIVLRQNQIIHAVLLNDEGKLNRSRRKHIVHLGQALQCRLPDHRPSAARSTAEHENERSVDRSSTHQTGSCAATMDDDAFIYSISSSRTSGEKMQIADQSLRPRSSVSIVVFDAHARLAHGSDVVRRPLEIIREAGSSSV